MTQADDERWLEGRTRHVRVYLTADEHALVRQAAALADKSVSRFSIETIVQAARQAVSEAVEGETHRLMIQETEPTKPKKRKGK